MVVHFSVVHSVEEWQNVVQRMTNATSESQDQP